MSVILTRSGRPVEDPRSADPDEHEKSKDWNARQFIPNRILSWRAAPKDHKSVSLVWTGFGLVLCGLLSGLVFGLSDSAAVIVTLAFVIAGLATMAAGFMRRRKTT